MAKSDKAQLSATKQLMASLVRMKPKPHEELKRKKDRVKKPPKQGKK